MRALVPVILLVTILPSLCGKDPGGIIRQPYLQINYHTGVYWSRTIHLVDQVSAGYRAIDARLGFQSTGGKPWHQHHHFPRYGFGIHYADLIKDRSDTIVGDPVSAFMFYRAPWARFGPVTFSTDMGVGLSYTGLIHDPDTNPYNDLIASHINLYFEFIFNLAIRLSERFDLSAGFGVSHYSNGRIHSPQKGVNHWGGSFGLSYFFNGPGKGSPEKVRFGEFNREKRRFTEPEDFKKFEEVQVMLAVGAVDHQVLGEEEGTHYLTSSLTADYAYRYSYKSAVTFGVDLLYDASIEEGIKGIEPGDVTTFQKTYLGGHIGYQFFVDRVTILINFGSYFKQHTYDRGFLFSRWGARVRLTDHLHAHCCIKTKQGVRSDWIEWGLAYSVKTRSTP